MVWGFALKSPSDQRTIQAANLSQAKSLVSLAGSINDQNNKWPVLSMATLDRYRKRRQRRLESTSADSPFTRVELSGANQTASHSSSDVIVLLSNGSK
jgi:hypothetical protein